MKLKYKLLSFLLISSFIVSVETLVFSDDIRIVSLSPVLTEMMVELEAEHLLAGKTSYCKVSSEYKGKVKDVGGYLDTSIEQVVSLNPDLVLSLKGNSQTPAKLRNMGIRVMELKNESLSDIEKTFLEISAVLKKEKIAGKIFKNKFKKLREVSNRIKSALGENTSFLLLIDEGDNSWSRKSYYAAGTNTFYSEILQLSGLENVFKSELMYGILSTEGIYSLKPDLIILIGDSSRSLNLKSKDDFLLPDAEIVKISNEVMLRPGIKFDKIAELFFESLSGIKPD